MYSVKTSLQGEYFELIECPLKRKKEEKYLDVPNESNYNLVTNVKDLQTDCNEIFGKTKSTVPVASN